MPLRHGSLEDTDSTTEELAAAFGARLRKLIEEVTDKKTLVKDTRTHRQIEHAENLSGDAVPIELGDRISNVLDVTHAVSYSIRLSHQKRIPRLHAYQFVQPSIANSMAGAGPTRGAGANHVEVDIDHTAMQTLGAANGAR